MSGASKTNSPLVLYAEGVDPEADLVLVCGGRKFYVRRAVCEMAFPVVADSPDKSNGAEFVILGHSAETLEKLLLLVDPDAAGPFEFPTARHCHKLTTHTRVAHPHRDRPDPG